MKHTRVYRRDLPRTHTSSQYSTTTDAQWDNILTWLEQRRNRIVKQARTDSGDADGYYYCGLGVLQEAGGDTSEFPQDVDSWRKQPPAKRARTIQRLATQLSRILNPKEKEGEGGGGGGEGKPGGNSTGESKGTPRPELAPMPENPNYSGGGENMYGEVEDQSLFYAVRNLISKLAEYDDYTETVPYGHTKWDGKQVITAYWNPLVLADAKRDYAKRVEDIYLILDVSGSVSYLAKKVAAIAAGSAGIVKLYQGQEASPTHRVERDTPLRSARDPFPEWRHPKEVGESRWSERESWWEAFKREHLPLYPEWVYQDGQFEQDLAWFLYNEKPPKGSRLLFWGDTQSVGIYCPRLTAALLRPYRAVWLLSEPYAENWPPDHAKVYSQQRLLDRPGELHSPEWPKLQAVGIPVIENIQTAEHIRNLLQALQTMQ